MMDGPDTIIALVKGSVHVFSCRLKSSRLGLRAQPPGCVGRNWPCMTKNPICGAFVQYAWRKHCPANSAIRASLKRGLTRITTHTYYLHHTKDRRQSYRGVEGKLYTRRTINFGRFR